MESDLQAERAAVAAAAEAALREDPPARRSLSIRILPSFGDWSAYVLWELRGQWCLRRRVWRHLLDAEKMRTPVERLRHPRPLVPTIETGEIAYDAVEAETPFRLLASLRLPAVPAGGGLVLDGTRHEVELTNGSTTTAFRWNPTPEGWEVLVEAVDDCLSVFDAALAARR